MFVDNLHTTLCIAKKIMWIIYTTLHTEDENDTSNVGAGKPSFEGEGNKNFVVPHQFSGLPRELTNEIPERDAIPPRQPYHYTLRPGYKKPRPVLGSTPDLMIYAKNRYSSETPEGVGDPGKEVAGSAKPESHGSVTAESSKQGKPLKGNSSRLKAEPYKYDDHTGSAGLRGSYNSELRGSDGREGSYLPHVSGSGRQSNVVPGEGGGGDGEWGGRRPYVESGRMPGENREKIRLRLPLPAGKINIVIATVRLRVFN